MKCNMWTWIRDLLLMHKDVWDMICDQLILICDMLTLICNLYNITYDLSIFISDLRIMTHTITTTEYQYSIWYTSYEHLTIASSTTKQPQNYHKSTTKSLQICLIPTRKANQKINWSYQMDYSTNSWFPLVKWFD